MKPAPFDYQAPATLREAIDLLGSNPEAAVIAGGQSLMPVLAFRLATPSLLVDLRRIRELDNIGVGEDGVRLGALVRWRDIEDDQRLVDGASAAAGGGRPRRALPDPQSRHGRRQSRPCRPGRRTPRRRGDVRGRNHPRRFGRIANGRGR